MFSSLLGSSIVKLMASSSERIYATCHAFQVCCSQSSCPLGRPLLTCASAGDTQTFKGRSGSVSCGSHCFFPFVLLFVPSEHLWWVWDLILNIEPLLPSSWASPLHLDVGYLFWWNPAFSCRWLFSSWLLFWCSCRRRWVHIFLLCHLTYSVLPCQSCGFSSGHVWMWELDHKKGWELKNWCFWTVVLEKTLENPLDCKEIKPVNPKGNQSWTFIGRTDAEAEAPIVWPPDVTSWLIRKDANAEKDWGQEEKGTTEDEMVGWHHWLNVHEFDQAPGVAEGQVSLSCCHHGVTELDTTEQLNKNN